MSKRIRKIRNQGGLKLMENKDVLISWLLTGLTGISAATAMDLIAFALAIICGIVSLCFTIWKWIREAKKDGKITKEEVEDLIDQVGGQVEDIKSNLDNLKKKD